MSHTITKRCTGCTACTKQCPTGAIHGERNALHVITPEMCMIAARVGVYVRSTRSKTKINTLSLDSNAPCGRSQLLRLIFVSPAACACKSVPPA